MAEPSLLPDPFSYELPPDRIAARPAAVEGKRSDSRLLVADSSGVVDDSQFFRLRTYLRPGDLIVLNNSKVLPLRFYPLSAPDHEVLLLRPSSGDGSEWVALARPMRSFREGDTVQLSRSIQLRVLGRTPEHRFLRVTLHVEEDAEPARASSVLEHLAREGTMPIPPYIRDGHSDELDKETYQTVFADVPGSAAAPTAGLHFTEELLAELRADGLETCTVTLHVGPTSFLPVDAGRGAVTAPLPEQFHVPAGTLDAIHSTKARDGRVVAVGTTVARTLETVAGRNPGLNSSAEHSSGETSLIITPGHRFQLVDLLITNFHQPGTTHLLLVEAFVGRNALEAIYAHGLTDGYRFLSYGDAMLLCPSPNGLQPTQNVRCLG